MKARANSRTITTIVIDIVVCHSLRAARRQFVLLPINRLRLWSGSFEMPWGWRQQRQYR